MIIRKHWNGLTMLRLCCRHAARRPCRHHHPSPSLARNASINAVRLAQTLSEQLSANGYVVVSGLARGIDTTAHNGALTRGTVAVIAGGIDIQYPPENGDLHNAIAESGLLLAEIPTDTQKIAPFLHSQPYQELARTFK